MKLYYYLFNLNTIRFYQKSTNIQNQIEATEQKKGNLGGTTKGSGIGYRLLYEVLCVELFFYICNAVCTINFRNDITIFISKKHFF